MALYDSPDCLARLRVVTRQNSTSALLTDAQGYQWLGQGQIDVLGRMASYVPLANVSSIRQMTATVARSFTATTVSGSTAITSSALFTLADVGAGVTGNGIPSGTTITGVSSTSAAVLSAAATASASVTVTVTPDPLYTYTFIFGLDADGNYLYPVGGVTLYAQLNEIPDRPMFEGVDYLMEGERIRIPDNAPYNGGTTPPYYQGTVLPLTLSATVSPVLRPVQARELIVDAAAILYAQANGVDASPYTTMYNDHWDKWMTVLQMQYHNPGRLASTNPWAGAPRNRFYGASGYGFGYRRGF